MNRKIKFRAWLPPFNKMETSLFGLRSDGVPSFNTDAILMQFTGLLDRNGKEIYEHDIDGSDPEALMIVIYQDGQFGLKYSLEDSYFDNCIDWSKTEIIGNIHENPELLK